MGSESASESDAGPVDDVPGSTPPPPTEVDAPPGTEATIDFRPDEPGLATRPISPTADPAVKYAFLDPPRGNDELGWLAHYRVRKAIGGGGMGLVFRAEDSHLLRRVALKVIRPELAASPEAATRFLREARSAAAIKHDNVVTIYQVGEARGVAFLAMEYLEGISLARWLDLGRQPSIDLILRIGRETASGLSAAHRLGLVHRDIKPANIWLEAPNGRVKILDFGQARAEREDVQITQVGSIMGSPAFMSPEQADGKPVSFSSDLFSLGCVLYRLCCGRLPFEGKTILSVLNALASHTPTPPLAFRPEIPKALSALVMRLLAKTPDARPASAQSVVDEIRTIERQLAAHRQQANAGPGTGFSTFENRRSNRAKGPIVGSPSRLPLGARQPSPSLYVTALAFIVVIMGLAVWFSHPGRFRWGQRRDFPSQLRGFRRPPNSGEFGPQINLEEPEPPQFKTPRDRLEMPDHPFAPEPRHPLRAP